MLVVTGGEAMYADLGHFGARPIRIGWFSIVYPRTTTQLSGAGCLPAGRRTGLPAATCFSASVPPLMLYPMVLLATMATVIASQALISGGLHGCLASYPPRSFPHASPPATPTVRMPAKCTFHSSTGVLFLRMRPVGRYFRLRHGARRGLWSCGGRSNGDHVGGDGCGCAFLLGGWGVAQDRLWSGAP